MKLIYILGMGHTGSTLLDRVLGAQQDVLSIGELKHLYRLLDDSEKKCTCGNPYRACEFWKGIVEKVEFEGLENYLMPADPSDGTGRKTQFNWSKEYLKKFADINKTIYQHLLDHGEASTIVDSSKDLNRLVCLKKSGSFDLKVIILRRSGLAYLASKKARSARGFNPIRWTIIYVQRHIRLFQSWKILASMDSINISYSDLARYPERQTKAICDFSGVQYDPSTLDIRSDRYFSVQENHNIGGSVSRKNKERVPIKYKDNWRQRLALKDILVYILFGGALVDAVMKYKFKGR